MTEPVIRPSQASASPQNGRAAVDPDRSDRPISNGDLQFDVDRESPPGTPRWVKLFGIAAIVLVVLVAGMHLAGGHNPMSGLHGTPMHEVQTP